MDLKLSEIYAMLEERVEQCNSGNRKCKATRDIVMQAEIAKLRSEMEYKNIFNHKCISTSTPVRTPKSSKKPQASASFSSASKTIQETPSRKVLRVRRKIISNARRLTFDSEEFDNN